MPLRLGLIAAVCAMAACQGTTGVLLHIYDATPASQVTITAATAFGSVTHALAAPPGPSWTLSFIASFRPEIGTVTFSVQPLAGSRPVGSCPTRSIYVPQYRVVDQDITCGPSLPPAVDLRPLLADDLAASDGGAPASDYFATVLADNPLAYYHLGEASGTTALDATPNMQDGTYGATVTRHQPSPLVNPQAVSDGAAGFPGGTATAATTVRSAGTGLLLPTAALSVELWLTSAGTNQGAVLLQFDYSSGKLVPVYSLSLESGHIVLLVHAAAGTTAGTLAGKTTIAAAKPYHVVGTYDGMTQAMSLYVNGVLDGSSNTNNGDLIHGDPATSGIGIGGSHNDGAVAWDGVIDEVALYGYALTQARVQAHYASGTAAK
jgi:hypothetical protein